MQKLKKSLPNFSLDFSSRGHFVGVVYNSSYEFLEQSTTSSHTPAMAKWGEGDPRWIVEDRPDAVNVNNWHW